MTKKHCTSCGRIVWHNAMKKVGEYRCTFCGSPCSTNPAKREHQEAIRKKQAAQPMR